MTYAIVDVCLLENFVITKNGEVAAENRLKPPVLRESSMSVCLSCSSGRVASDRRIDNNEQAET